MSHNSVINGTEFKHNFKHRVDNPRGLRAGLKREHPPQRLIWDQRDNALHRLPRTRWSDPREQPDRVQQHADALNVGQRRWDQVCRLGGDDYPRATRSTTTTRAGLWWDGFNKNAQICNNVVYNNRNWGIFWSSAMEE
jgi:hypothetical protein